MSEPAGRPIEAPMRMRLGVYGVTEEALALLPSLTANPEIEIVRTFDVDVASARARLAHCDPGVAALVGRTLTSDAVAFVSDRDLTAIVDAVGDGALDRLLSERADQELQVLSPLAAGLLWGCSEGRREEPRQVALVLPMCRVDTSIARARARGITATLVTICIDNAAEVEQAAGAERIARVLERVRDAVGRHASSKELVCVSEDDSLIALFDWGPRPREPFIRLTRAVARDLVDDEALNDPVPISLAFGLAIDPSDGRSVDALVERAKEPRVRTL